MHVRNTSGPVALAISLMLMALTGWAQNDTRLEPELIGKIEKLVQEKRQASAIPGISVAIALDGKLVYAKGFGWADLENSVPATEKTVFRTASIAKPMTATAVMQLVEAGKIDLDGPIQKYCPVFPEKEWPVTVRQLLSHLGGVRHYNSGEEASGKQHFYSISQALDLVKQDPLLHEPGTKYSYSTYGFNILGCAVEGASGQDFEAYMTEHVFGPAGMSQTAVDNVFALIPHRARGYMRVDQETYNSLPPTYQRKVEVGAVVNANLHDTSMKVPGGGLVSTARDLVRFALAVRDGKLVSQKSVALMWTPQATSAGETIRYGLGWGLGEFEGMRAVNHSGGQAGTSTMLGMLPDQGLAIAVMCNLQRVSANEILEAVSELVLESRAVAAQ